MWVRWGVGLVVTGLVVWLFVVPRFGDLDEAVEVVRGVDPYRLVGGASLVALAFVAQAQMTRTVIAVSSRPGLVDMVRIELASAAVSHTFPGGTVAGTALGYRLLKRAGVPGTSAGLAVGVRGVGSALVLNVALWIALAVWIPLNGFRSSFGVAAIVGVVAIALVAVASATVIRTPSRIVRTVEWIARHVPRLDEADAAAATERVLERLRELAADRRLAGRLAGWAAVHWLAEAASLWIVLDAFGWSGGPLAVFVAFGVVNVLAVVPVTPRGLGIVEAVLIPMLVALGAPGQVAALGVLAWRLLSFWAPIAVGALSYLSLHVVEVPEGGQRT